MIFRNAENSPITLLKGDSTTGALPVILKILRTLPRRFVEETVFSIVTPGFPTDFHVIFHEISFFHPDEGFLGVFR